MKFLSHFRWLLVAGLLVFGVSAVQAQDLGAIKSRMEQRLGAVNALKDRGAAGENNRGYLEARGNAGGGDQQTISEENADRRAVYAALAQKTGASPEAVGQQRAQQLAAIAKPGHWIQDAGGAWKQK